MKKRLKEMEDEAAALREMQAKVEKEMGSVQGSSFSSFFFEKKRKEKDFAAFFNYVNYPFLGRKYMLKSGMSWVELDMSVVGISSNSFV